MNNVATRPISANTVSPKKANTAVVNADVNMNGYPALATGKAVSLGGSGQIKLFKRQLRSALTESDHNESQRIYFYKYAKILKTNPLFGTFF